MTHIDVDPIFEYEQAHLSSTYAKLEELMRKTAERLESNTRELKEFKGSMRDELSADFDSADFAMETYAAYDVLNNVVDSFNIALDSDFENLRRFGVLLRKPYFARVRLRFDGKDEPRDIYLGAVGVADENHRQLVVDWRSPVAETYYNQESGRTSYWVNGKRVEADLELRRQFEVDGAHLIAYFDTQVAIDDPMLLASLSQERSAHLQAITATIQREQNEVVRHPDVPALLVRGVAGSGKTSVMLQRVAFLLFRQRENLTADQVRLISPNPVFERYIWNVLPELGEKNPKTMLYSELMARLGPGDRALGDDVDPQVLTAIDTCAPTFKLDQGDVREISVGGRVLLSAQQVWNTIKKHQPRSHGPRLITIVREDLEEKLERRVQGLASNEKVWDEILLLDDDEMERIFGHVVAPQDEEELRELAGIYLADVCAPAFEALERHDWLRVDRIGMRMLNVESLSSGEWIWLKMALTGETDRSARYVMIDEVQDYTETQLMVLARYFSRAHFLMLGDPNQAIRKGTAEFSRIKELFVRERGEVQELELMTSYRSTPAITELFASLLPRDEKMRVASVQREGIDPLLLECTNTENYLDEVVRQIRALNSEHGLLALVVADGRRARWLSSRLCERMGSEAPLLLEEGIELPESGAIISSLRLAKGLEFDSVIVADAQESVYGDDTLSRRRLYTAISRATRRIVVISEGAMTQLLACYKNQRQNP